MEELTSGCVATENNLLGQDMESVINAHGALEADTNLTDEDGNILNPLSEEGKIASSLRLAEGDLPGQQPATALLTQWAIYLAV